MRGYHVTTGASASSIMATGFEGSWGDIGFGVYFWATQDQAQAYAVKGGWDGTLKDPVILEVSSDDIRNIDEHEIHAEWDADLYRSMVLFREMNEDEPDAPWRPEEMRMLEGFEVPSP